MVDSGPRPGSRPDQRADRAAERAIHEVLQRQRLLETEGEVVQDFHQ